MTLDDAKNGITSFKIVASAYYQRSEQNTTQSINLRAVLSKAAEKMTPSSAHSNTHDISPDGCSTESSFCLPSGIIATSAAGDPGMRHAVATLTAANTPIVACARDPRRVTPWVTFSSFLASASQIVMA